MYYYTYIVTTYRISTQPSTMIWIAIPILICIHSQQVASYVSKMSTLPHNMYVYILMAHYFLVTKQHIVNQIMNTHYSSYYKQCTTSFHNIRCAKDISTICSYMPSVYKLESVWKLSPFS